MDGIDITLNLLDRHRGHLASHSQGVSTVSEVGSLLGIDAGSRLLVMKVLSLSFAEPREAHQFNSGSSTHSTEPLRHVTGVVVGHLHRDGPKLEFVSDSLTTPTLGAEVYPLDQAELDFRGTRDQIVATTAFAAAASEPIGVIATAGTGKTYLMMALAAHAPGKWTHLASSDAQRNAFLARIGKATHVTSRTLAYVAHQAASEWFQKSRDARSTRPPRMAESYLTAAEQAERTGMPALGNEPPVIALQTVLRAIGRWCYSSDREIGLQHFDSWRIAPKDKAAYLGWAQRIWTEMFAPTGKERVFPVRLYHLVKWL